MTSNPRHHESADVLIIGSGMSGAIASRVLAEAGLRIVCLEQGDWTKPESRPHDKPDWVDAKNQGKTIAGYGAPGKGNTLLNYCGIRTDFLDFTVDRKPYKHGRLLPGTRIPIFPPEHLMEAKPDLVVILPWNLATEIAEQLAPIQAWGGRCLVPIPEVSYVL